MNISGYWTDWLDTKILLEEDLNCKLSGVYESHSISYNIMSGKVKHNGLSSVLTFTACISEHNQEQYGCGIKTQQVNISATVYGIYHSRMKIIWVSRYTEDDMNNKNTILDNSFGDFFRIE